MPRSKRKNKRLKVEMIKSSTLRSKRKRKRKKITSQGMKMQQDSRSLQFHYLS
jgi:hypothetical protein